jgi:hypothetical protein
MRSTSLSVLVQRAMPAAPTRLARHAGRLLASLCVAAACAAQDRHAAAGAEGQAFVQDFREAAARGDAAALAAHTALPFLYEGRRVGRAAFIAEVVPALFTPAVRRCLASPRTRAAAEEGRLVVWCAPYAFYLGADARGQWRLEEFATDGEH